MWSLLKYLLQPEPKEAAGSGEQRNWLVRLKKVVVTKHRDRLRADSRETKEMVLL